MEIYLNNSNQNYDYNTIEIVKQAIRNLNGNTFKLWLYLFALDKNQIYQFTPAKVAKELGISDEGARNARKELINKGYLQKKEQGLEFIPTL